ncbi:MULTISPECIES: hypothetical protein [unclassified Pseudomonas]|jgi:hypothetical protein|uniref:hypothetical protein n=1 Tax=unclassified Pseudomonas TaxID=196821 RepID=UPI00040DE49D|nr:MULTISPECIES: hypothetical protein [unclassified Pseudomonas]ATP49639.1 hypothetical protein CR512_09765 [Pseudomonas putida]MCX2684568.1 hypothetical protein [Pseudomonas sp. DCB_AW]MDE4538017.1 hypothetical protein [Pseudomonas sp. ITEM 17296]SMF25342.1 hypothetical protein SAMN02745962_02575 [Pseudomonas sp. LAIL14HWK12:I11]SMR74147.1 hypothetical protein SAMN05661028_01835 [Pseudomonas sp. LAIL14HWK12:I10]
MRFPSLLALSVAGALLLPVAANAGSFPAGAKQNYMSQCIEAATAQGLDAKAAQQHCSCGATAIEKNFSDEQIKDLDSKDGVDAKLMQKAQTVVQQACMKG